MLTYFILLCICGFIHSCPHVKPMESFDLTAFGVGRWYEVARYSHDLEKNGDCVVVDYSGINVDGKNAINATIREVVDKKVNFVPGIIYPHAEPGRITYVSSGPVSYKITSTIINSDNKNYAIFYNCIDTEETSSTAEVLWVMSRTANVQPELKSVIHDYLTSSDVLKEKNFIWDHFTPEACLGEV